MTGRVDDIDSGRPVNFTRDAAKLRKVCMDIRGPFSVAIDSGLDPEKMNPRTSLTSLTVPHEGFPLTGRESGQVLQQRDWARVFLTIDYCACSHAMYRIHYMTWILMKL